MSDSAFKVRNFIKAKSEKRLRSLMYQKQLQLKMAAMQFDVIHANGYWFAWFYEVLNTESLNEIANGNTKDDRR
jgi:hypothetical protein